jgi:ATP-dependent Lon protease
LGNLEKGVLIFMNTPILLTRGIVVFPTTTSELEIGRIKSINSVNVANKDDKKIIVVSQTDPQIEEPKINELYGIGTLCEIVSITDNEDKSIKLRLKGIKRVKISKVTEENKTLFADYATVKEINADTPTVLNQIHLLFDMIKSNLNNLSEKESAGMKSLFLGTPSPSKIADQVASVLPIDFISKQNILEQLDVAKRVETILNHTSREEDKKLIDREVNKKVNDTLSKQQKEFYLREKMRAVKEELGQINSNENDFNSLRKRVEENPYPEYIKKRALTEISRMESSANPQENSMTRSYVE